MRKLFFVSFLAFFLTGCFEIIEEIDVKKNGTGQMSVTLNLSESKEDLKGYMDSGKIDDINLPDQQQMKKYLSKIERTIESVDGMSNASAKGDFNEFIFTFTADFTNVNAMNAAVNKLTKELSRGMLTVNNKYEYKNGKFVRSFGSIISPENYDKLPIMQRFVLESARMKSILRFQQPVKKLSNQNAQLSAGDKVVKFESTLSDIAKGTKQVENTISF